MLTSVQKTPIARALFRHRLGSENKRKCGESAWHVKGSGSNGKAADDKCSLASTIGLIPL